MQVDTEFGLSNTAGFKFYLLDEDGDVLTISSEQEFRDNEDYLNSSRSLLYAEKLNNSQIQKSLQQQLKSKLKGASASIKLSAEVQAYIDAAIKKEIAAYCEFHLPKLVADQVRI